MHRLRNSMTKSCETKWFIEAKKNIKNQNTLFYTYILFLLISWACFIYCIALFFVVFLNSSTLYVCLYILVSGSLCQTWWKIYTMQTNNRYSDHIVKKQAGHILATDVIQILSMQNEFCQPLSQNQRASLSSNSSNSHPPTRKSKDSSVKEVWSILFYPLPSPPFPSLAQRNI